ncbi:MAG: methionyl-tRNA formyltransferase [Treponematales bacterium]
MRALFAGSPAIAVPSLRALWELERSSGAAFALAGVLTNPDSPRGRSGRPEPTAVSAAAREIDGEREKAGLPPLEQVKPEKLDGAARERAAALKADLLVSFAYGRIFGPKFLALFPLGGVNVHPSLLPRHRGASPLQAALLAGDRETGVSVQTLAREMDSGGILAAEAFPLAARETAETLAEKAAEKGAALLAGFLGELCRAEDPQARLKAARPQEGEPSYCRVIRKEDGRIDWTQSAARIDAQIRAYTPWPLSFTTSGGETLYLLEAAPAAEAGAPAWEGAGQSAPPGAVRGIDRERGILIQTGEGLLAVTRLQFRARKALDWRSFLNGARGFLGSTLE